MSMEERFFAGGFEAPEQPVAKLPDDDLEILDVLTCLTQEQRALLAPVLSPDPGPLTPRQRWLRDWLHICDNDPFVKAEIDRALADGEPIPEDPAHARTWAGAREIDRNPGLFAAFLAARGPA